VISWTSDVSDAELPMKQNAPEKDGPGDDNTMADEPQLSRTDDQDSSDDDTVKGEQEADHIAEILEEELQPPSTPTPLGNGTIAQRYREIIQDNESENGSTDAIPRRAGSPIDSLLSIPDDTPSVQVRWSYIVAFGQANTLSGLRHILSEQQRASVSCEQTGPRQSDTVLPALRPQIPVAHILAIHPLSPTVLPCLLRQP
jgi:hypothetical protein